jgi:phosphate transport system permease protein
VKHWQWFGFSRFRNLGDAWFEKMTFVFGLSIPLLLLALVLVLFWQARLSIFKLGPGFVFSSAWDPLNGRYGAWPFIYGTLLSSFLALLVAVPLGVGCALYLSEISSSKTKEWVAVMVELLAAVPSVVFGLWGIFTLGTVFGLNLFSGGMILAIMILPTITALSREVFQSLPSALRESALALGATRWEMVKLAVIGPSRSGVIGAVILGLGRALGETMAVTMVIGNCPQASVNIFAPSYTLAAVIANEFAEAVTDMNLSVLIELALILLFITLLVNGAARILIWKTVGKQVN